jgi:TolB protein
MESRARIVSFAFIALAVAACGLARTAGPQPTEPVGPRPTTIGKIAFTRGFLHGSIFVMDADGTHVTRVTVSEGDDSGPKWSPDGKRIAFARRLFNGTPPYPQQIWVINPDGSLMRLTDYPGSDAYAAWSPDGSKIAFVRTAPLTHSPGLPGQIYLMNADGSNPTQLTSSDLDTMSPTWSPDSKRIAFARSSNLGLRDPRSDRDLRRQR